MGDCPEPGGELSDVALEVSPRKRQKTEAVSPSKNPSRKGKEKIEDGEGDLSSICGICLSEGGKANRGVIDCCDHYFCFVCIMEWAKVESRCPMCKQRFESIWRPKGPGSCLQERLVDVPVRDQACQSYGQNGAGSVDLYADIQCTICKGSENESVLLLCDLCDSAAHTYCVGLGDTVPEGDWYCHDCTISRNEHSRPATYSDSIVENLSTDIEAPDAAQEHVLISETVKDDPVDCSLHGSSSQSSQSNHIESHGISGRKVAGKKLQNTSRPRRWTSQQVVADQKSISLARSQTADCGARTLSRCKSLQNRITALRESWNALRTGSISFSSRCFSSGSAENHREKHKTPLSICRRSSKVVVSMGVQNVASHGITSCSSDTISKNNGYDVNRAWKMMEAAKTLSGGPLPNSTSNCSSSKGLKSLVTKDKPPACKISCAVEKGTHTVDIHVKNCIAKSKSDRCNLNNNCVNKDVLLSSSDTFVGYCDSSECHIPVAAVGNARCFGKDSNPWLHEPKIPNVHIENLDNDGRTTAVSNSCHSEHKPEASSVRKTEPCNNSKTSGASQVKDESAATGYESDKCHIQSLVKLNLKLLTKGRRLGADRFKEVARIATHTILAACGLEHSQSIVLPFSKLYCNHATKQGATSSSLLPDCCRECFSFFIQDVVSNAISEKVGHSTS